MVFSIVLYIIIIFSMLNKRDHRVYKNIYFSRCLFLDLINYNRQLTDCNYDFFSYEKDQSRYKRF